MPLTEVPTYKDWVDKTAVTGRRRSKELVAIDDAIAWFHTHPSGTYGTDTIREALSGWIEAKKRNGSFNWQANERNKKNYMSDLFYLLSPPPSAVLSDKDIAAREVVRTAMSDAIGTVFQGKRMTWKLLSPQEFAKVTPGGYDPATRWKTFKAGAGRFTDRVGAVKTAGSPVVSIGRNIKKLANAAPTVSDGAGAGAVSGAASASNITQELLAMVGKVVGVTNARDAIMEISNAIGIEIVGEFAANCIPFLGVASSGAKAVKNVVALIEARYEEYDIAPREIYMRPGDPIAALDAVQVLLARKSKRAAAKAATAGAAFTAKLTSTLLDGGTATTAAIGLAETTANLLILIYELSIDYQEKAEANLMLQACANREHDFDLELFAKAPLLGCYFIMIAGDSAILFFMVDHYGRPDWQLNLEALKKRMAPVYDSASDLIKNSRLQVEGLMAHRLNASRSTGEEIAAGAERHARDFVRFITAGRVFKKPPFISYNGERGERVEVTLPQLVA